jgi:periplasmic protein CpxP/Spy
MEMSKLVTTTLVSLALAAAAPLAAAQATAPDAPQQRQARPDQGKRDVRLPSERVEARLAEAKTKLKITAAQEAQWNAFADVTRKHAKAADDNFKAMRDGKSQAQSKKLTAVERLERRQQMAATHAQRLSEIVAAAKPLYAALSAEQKAIADDMLTPRRGQGGRGHHGPA